LAAPIAASRAAVRIRPARPSDSSAFRALRLEALKNHPEAFAAAYEAEAAEPQEYWAGRLTRLGSPSSGELFFAEAAEGLVGMAGVWRKEGRKVRHAGTVWGVYVRPEWRGARIGERLVRACIAWARRHRLRILRLASMAGNEAAIRCYERCGFTPYGLEPEAIVDGGVAYDDLLMALRIASVGG
jgi:ribosomal protein S18 acetylase RimI-like enzyme